MVACPPRSQLTDSLFPYPTLVRSVDATPLQLQRLDDLHGAHVGRAGDGAGGKAGDEGVHRILARGEPTLDTGDDVHDVAVELDGVLLGHLHAAARGDADDVVAAQITQHEALGELPRVAPQNPATRAVLGRRGAARAPAGDARSSA